jgi:ABC-type uncharacterized transport system permease subunit
MALFSLEHQLGVLGLFSWVVFHGMLMWRSDAH